MFESIGFHCIGVLKSHETPATLNESPVGDIRESRCDACKMNRLLDRFVVNFLTELGAAPVLDHDWDQRIAVAHVRCPGRWF